MFSVRPALAADIPRIIELNDAVSQETAGQTDSTTVLAPPRTERAAYFSRYIDSETRIIFLAETDADTCIIGYLSGHIEPAAEHQNFPNAELEGMYVDASKRAQGLERELARTFLYWCRAQGVGRISVTTTAINVETIRFYQQLGFQPKHISFELNLR